MLSTLPLIVVAAPIKKHGKPKSFVYCEGPKDSIIFAGKINGDKSLSFGLSVWTETGDNASVFDTAPFYTNTWRVGQQSNVQDGRLQCQINIRLNKDNSVDIWTSRKKYCDQRIRNDLLIGELHFPPTAYRGPVTTQLDDAEAFQQANVCDAN